jgi:peroxiredoxin (alkyl hydroperoxide reductase subunit C)
MSVKVGDAAPVVTVDAYVRDEAHPIQVEVGGAAEAWTVLFFYPRDFTFVCPTELRGFAELEADFALEGAAVVAASTDSWHVHRAWLETSPGLTGIHYPVVADPAQELTRLYGVLDYDDGSSMRATFIIDPSGIVRHASVTDANVGRNPEETLRILKALRTGELCPVSWKPGQPTLQVAA